MQSRGCAKAAVIAGGRQLDACINRFSHFLMRSRFAETVTLSGLVVSFIAGLLIATIFLMSRLGRTARGRVLIRQANRRRMLNAEPLNETAKALVRET